MTTLVSWIGIDTHGQSSAYLVSDSRICWGNKAHYDNGRKVFASKKYPDIFGYAGDVLFPTIVLSQIIEMIDNGLLINERMSSYEKNKIIFQKIRYELKRYPDDYRDCRIKIIHISRDDSTDSKYPPFLQFELSYGKDKKAHTSQNKIPPISGVIKSYGSGSKYFESLYQELTLKRKNRDTTRHVYQSFVETLKHSDGTFGGAPQLVGLYRKPNSAGIVFGIIYNRRRYFLGTEVPKKSHYSNISWRNSKFEICDGDTKKRKPGASPQPVE